MWFCLLSAADVVLTFKSVDEPLGATVQIKAIELWLQVLLHRVILTLKSVHEPSNLFNELDKVVLTFQSVTHQMKTVKAIAQFP